MKKCPKCGCTKFDVTAHVTQAWIVDGEGNFIECTDDCCEVTHKPDDMDLWMCFDCCYEAPGYEFNV